MLLNLKLAYNKLVKIQMIKESKTEITNLSLYSMFKNNNNKQKKEDTAEKYQNKNRIKFGPAIQRFRKAVAKHFLSVSL